MKYDDSTAVLTVSEYELHDIIAQIANLYDDGQYGEHVDQIVIEPTNPEMFTPELKRKWEQKMRAFINYACSLDSEYHDDAEQTCGG